jgi:hypothetical protein
MEILMDALAEKLGIKLQEWKPEISDRVRQYISEIIDLADRDILNSLPSRNVEQDVKCGLSTSNRIFKRGSIEKHAQYTKSQKMNFGLAKNEILLILC